MSNLIIYSDNKLFSIVCQYLYNKYDNKFNNILYLEQIKQPTYDWASRTRLTDPIEKLIRPNDCNVELEINDYKIQVIIETHFSDNNHIQKLRKGNHCSVNDIILQKMTLKNNIDENKQILIDIVDMSVKYIADKREEYKKTNKETIRTFYWKQDYWTLFSKVPKRSIDTLYHPDGVVDNVLDNIKTFIDNDTRNEYLKYGIPYKLVHLLYGVPGSGKTSLINCIGSEIDADIHYIPITTELKDTQLISAFSDLTTSEDDKIKIIVIEDIDCIFNKRKENDNNNITLQTLLNCLDGFACIEGMILFLTANNAETLDYALIRSSRIDYKIKFDYANEYQSKQMFSKFFSSDTFKDFYNKIDHLKYTTAMLQEFLFYNRKENNIMEKIPRFLEIVKNNEPKNLNSENKKNNLYM